MIMNNKKSNNSNDHNDKNNHNDKNDNNDYDNDNNNNYNNDDKTIIDRFMITPTNWWSLIMIVAIIIIIIDHHDDLGMVMMIIVVVIIIIIIIIITMSLRDAAAATAATASSGWWRGLFHSVLKIIWIECGQIYSNDYCAYQIYFTYQHTTTIVVKQSRRPWIIGSWYHIGKSRRCIRIFTYIMVVLHMFSTAKTGNSHINRLQSIQCLIVI